MARKQTIDLIVKTFRELGGNLNDVLGTKTNVNFLGKGKSPELMLDMDINVDALGVLPQSKAVEELTSSVGYAVSNKLNDIQANKLLSNMQKMKDFYIPPAAPTNVTDLATRTGDLDKAGLMSLRQGGDPTKYKVGDPITSENFGATGLAPRPTPTLNDVADARLIDDMYRTAGPRNLDEDKMYLAEFIAEDAGKVLDDLPASEQKVFIDRAEKALIKNVKKYQDLPPPGSRGGPDDIAAPFASADETFRNMAKAEGVDVSETILPTGKGLESIKNVQNNNLIVNELVDTIYLNAGVSKNAQPTVRANAREFLNRIKDLEDPEFPSGPTLSSVMEADDFKFMTEGGGAGLGDPLLLVQKYFGPKVAAAIAKLDNPKDIQTFAERLVRIKDGRGRSVTDRMFDPKTVNPEDFEFQDGGRVPFFVGGAARMGFQALRKYGFTGKDISRAFAGLGTDKTLVGKEKTEYFKQLNKVLKNPDDYPDAIKELQKQLGIEVGIGFRSGGLAKILEV